jgi:uncharacterized membrane protein YkoI
MRAFNLAVVGLLAASSNGITPAAQASTLSWTAPADIAAFGKRSISLIQAISVAQRQTNGRALHADFRAAQGKGVFEIEILANGAVTDVTIDGKSDKVIDTEPAGTADALPNDAKAVARAPVTLEDAAAQGDELGDWAVDAGFENIAGKAAYRVDILTDSKLSTIAIDPQSGKAVQSTKRQAGGAVN